MSLSSPLPCCGEGRLWSQDDRAPAPVPDEWREAFAPATHCLFEWTDYWLQHPTAEMVRVGESRLLPALPGLFRLRFENQLGLASIQPFGEGKALGPALHVEIISRKFPTPAAHAAFMGALLDDVFECVTRLPFAPTASTQRGTTSSARPTAPLFTLYFLLRHAPALRAALAQIAAAPHSSLHDAAAFVPLSEASEADADVLASIMGTQSEWMRAGFPFAQRLGGRVPAKVWQRRTADTLDNGENRFVLFFARQVLAGAGELPRQRWWRRIGVERQAVVQDAIDFLRSFVQHSALNEVGPLARLPVASRVLARRPGYREVLPLWTIFQSAARPLFGRWGHAMDVRDVASLYEMWSFFTLVEAITAILGEQPRLALRLDDDRLGSHSEARFGQDGTLVLNQGAPSYSTPFRPDFLWLHRGHPVVALDAKFRLERAALEDGMKVRGESTDLHKMHTYRDALGVRAAVSLYPGEVSVFYDRARGRLAEFSLKDVLFGTMAGVGAMAWGPAAK